MPPGYFKEWHVAVRVASSKKLVAFISAVPITLRVREKYENWLCKRSRS
jgi:glycylpeptide N-tetradecanoyltransferase